MDVQDVLGKASETITVKRVYGEPYEKNGLTLIPAAAVMGGGGGGVGSDQTGNEGSGSGFGLRARPVGAWVIKEDGVSWQPAMDVTRIAIGGQIFALVALLVIRSILKTRSKRLVKMA